MAGPTQRTLFNVTQIKENHGTINIENRTVGRPNSEHTMEKRIKARIPDEYEDRILGFCAGRRITRSQWLRHIMTLHPDWFDLIPVLNDKEVREVLIPMAKMLAKKF